MINLNFYKSFRVAVFFCLLSLLLFYLFKNIDDFLFIKNSLKYFYYLLGALLLILVMFVLGGVNLKYFLLPYNINLKFKEWFGLFVATTMWNYLTPFRGGAVFRAAYLKKKYDFSLSSFMSTLAGIYIIIFFVNSFFGILVLLTLLYFGFFNIIIFGIFLFLFMSTLSVVLFAPELKMTSNKFMNKIILVINGWSFISKNKKVIVVTSAVAFLNIILTAIITILEYRVFGIDLSFLNSLYLSVMGVTSLLISVTPGALGIKEAVLVFSASLVNIPASQVIAVSILDRIVWFAVIFALGPIFSYILMGNKAVKVDNSTNVK